MERGGGEEEKGTVCVTGAGGFVASWLVKLLLSNGYRVHGTVRDPDDEKNAHLRNLDKASERLQLFKSDLLDYNSVLAAVSGCEGIFHTACPVPSEKVPNPEPDMVAPAVTGTLNVMKACSEAKVHRVIYVSSVAAASMVPSWPKDRILNEDCWSDKEYCKKTDNWYCYSKTVAEELALEYGKENGIAVISVLPVLVIGPLLQTTVNASSLFLPKIVKGLSESVDNQLVNVVDVRDLAEALLLTYKKDEAAGRYICSSHSIIMCDLVDKLRSMYPDFKYPKNYVDIDLKPASSSEKLRSLGWKHRELEITIADSIKCYQDVSLLDKN